MATPLENLQSMAAGGGLAQPLPQPTQTQQVQQLLTTKATGRAAGPSAAPKATNIQEQVAINQARIQQQELQRAGMEAGTQLGMQAQEAQQQYEQSVAQLDEKQIGIQEQYQRQVEATFRDLARGAKEIDFQKDAAKVEQLGFQLRLSNSKYIDQVKMEGARSRLNSELAFKEALTLAIFDEQEKLLRSSLDFKRMMDADGREFNERLASMNLDLALEMAAIENKGQQQANMISGMTGVVKGGIEAYSSYSAGDFNKEYQTYLKGNKNPVDYDDFLSGKR